MPLPHSLKYLIDLNSQVPIEADHLFLGIIPVSQVLRFIEKTLPTADRL